MNDPVDQPLPPVPLRSAPGTGWCVFGGVLTLLTAPIPPLAIGFGVLCLFSGWRAARAARNQPARYRASAVPLAGAVLVAIGWAITAVVLLVLGALSGANHEIVHADPPASERW